VYDLGHITKLEKINKHSLTRLGKAVENKNRNKTWNIYNFGLQQILGFV